ncbi:hypothetical protein SP90_09160 [Halodesulfovibrio spirochaetisodalis]|uniref:Mannose-6-phosphate isomerase type II C-terminal domain-containing protein n=1 Tax=Halodesulfovibrio spirochaetisodalis TaxID=1560234 RepID=A0A1B7XCA3_9BACT|nr:hypothetical protein SP90_09160 [Halodesulfovibrio spirochaetisodalis]
MSTQRTKRVSVVTGNRVCSASQYANKEFRPWGTFQVVDYGKRHQVKRLIVYPGQRLSLQKHFHRAEHWVVVRGTALVTRGEEQVLLTENQSTFVPVGMVHRLENPGKVNLEIVEVQSGIYLEEDDIVRLDDEYGRGDQPAGRS